VPSHLVEACWRSVTGYAGARWLHSALSRTARIALSYADMQTSTLSSVEKSSSTQLMDALGPDQRSALEALGMPVRYPAEHTVFWEGQPSYSVLVIREGHVKVTRKATDGSEVILAIRGPGDVMGDEGVLLDQARSATVTTITEVTGVDVKADALVGFVNKHELWRDMLRAAVRRRNQSEEEVILTRVSVKSRLARWLLQLADEVGERETEGLVVSVSLSQQDLAARIGASRDAVTIELRRLREQGVIATGRRRIVIRDLDALHRTASSID
jgi:CRP/FNR family transcriptional regulator, cyclic AMP receptor protein